MQTEMTETKREDARLEHRACGNRGTEYRLLREMNEENEEIYSIAICGAGGESCYLRDVARHRASGIRLLMLFARAELSPIHAAEVMEDLLTEDPDRFS